MTCGSYVGKLLHPGKFCFSTNLACISHHFRSIHNLFCSLFEMITNCLFTLFDSIDHIKLPHILALYSYPYLVIFNGIYPQLTILAIFILIFPYLPSFGTYLPYSPYFSIYTLFGLFQWSVPFTTSLISRQLSFEGNHLIKIHYNVPRIIGHLQYNTCLDAVTSKQRD